MNKLTPEEWEDLKAYAIAAVVILALTIGLMWWSDSGLAPGIFKG